MKNSKEINVFVRTLKVKIPDVMNRFSSSLNMVSEEFVAKNGPVTSEDIKYLERVLKKCLGDFRFSFRSKDIVVWDEWEKLDFIFAVRLWKDQREGWEKLLRFSDLLFGECFDFYHCDGVGLR